MELEATERKWLVEGLLLDRGFNVIFGAEKSGKSRFLGYLLSALLFGYPTGRPMGSPGRVLYLLGEETEDELVARLKHYASLFQIDYSTVPLSQMLFILEANGIAMEKPSVQKVLTNVLERYQIDTLIIDPLRRVHGASESSNDEMSKVFNTLIDWKKKLGVTIILVHHTGKVGPDQDMTRIANWGRGAGDLSSALDWALYIRRYSGKSGDYLKVSRQGRAAPRPDLKVHDEQGRPFKIETFGGGG